MKDLRSLLKYCQPYIPNILLNIIFNLFSTIFSIFSFLMLIPFLNLIFNSDKMVASETQEIPFSFLHLKEYIAGTFNNNVIHYIQSSESIEIGKSKALLFICLFTVLVFFVKNIFRYFAVHFLAPMRTGIASNIRQQLFDKILNLHVLYFSDQRKGDVLTRLTNDVQEVEYGILHFLEVAFKEPVTIIATLVTMLLLSPKLTLFVLVILPISGYIIGKIGKTLKNASAQSQQLQGVINSIVDETISGIRIIKSFTAEKSLSEKFATINQQHNRIGTSMIRKRDLSTPLSEFLGISVVVIVLYVGGKMIIHHTSPLSAEAFIAFIVIFSQIIQPAKAFSNAFYFIQKGLASLKRIEEVLKEENKINDISNAVSISDFKDKIELKNVSFAFHERQVLKNINLEIPKGKKIAIVGVSGAGKSTFIQLLMRFFDVENGEILIDGINIKNIQQQDLRHLMALVTQQTTLFNDTVSNNISLGKTAEETQIEEAAKLAHADEFIQKMRQKYKENIGDNGTKISGGEQQRLSIARAIYKNAPILILDEATSHLDSNSEKLVQDALQNLLKDKTAIIIAHRLSTVQFADEIVVLKEGEIIEKGTHQQLMQQNGEYKKLVDLQQL
ncbi:MAG TPA: ABC transporter ATP-binding protein [Chitinophagales bacterium]|nr:ABC transporter ATP-binding protein [Chitinophagales bacterium]